MSKQKEKRKQIENYIKEYRKYCDLAVMYNQLTNKPVDVFSTSISIAEQHQLIEEKKQIAQQALQTQQVKRDKLLPGIEDALTLSDKIQINLLRLDTLIVTQPASLTEVQEYHVMKNALAVKKYIETGKFEKDIIGNAQLSEANKVKLLVENIVNNIKSASKEYQTIVADYLTEAVLQGKDQKKQIERVNLLEKIIQEYAPISKFNAKDTVRIVDILHDIIYNAPDKNKTQVLVNQKEQNIEKKQMTLTDLQERYRTVDKILQDEVKSLQEDYGKQRETVKVATAKLKELKNSEVGKEEFKKDKKKYENIVENAQNDFEELKARQKKIEELRQETRSLKKSIEELNNISFDTEALIPNAELSPVLSMDNQADDQKQFDRLDISIKRLAKEGKEISLTTLNEYFSLEDHLRLPTLSELKNLRASIRNKLRQGEIDNDMIRQYLGVVPLKKEENLAQSSSRVEVLPNSVAPIEASFVPSIIHSNEEKDFDTVQFVKSDVRLTKPLEGREFVKIKEDIDPKTGNSIATFYHPDFHSDGKLAGPDHQIKYIYKEDKNKGRVLIGIEAGKHVDCENPLVSLVDKKGKILSQQADTYFEKGEFKIRKTQPLYNMMQKEAQKLELGNLSISVNGKKDIDIREHLNNRNIKGENLVIMGMAAEDGNKKRAKIKLVESSLVEQVEQVATPPEEIKLEEKQQPIVKKGSLIERATAYIRNMFTSKKEVEVVMKEVEKNKEELKQKIDIKSPQLSSKKSSKTLDS